MLELKQYGEKIWAVIGDTTSEIAHSFIRFQEYYENPIYKGVKGFSVVDIEKWQATVSTKDYYSQWVGFNIPGRIFGEVYQAEGFKPFLEDETKLIQLLDRFPLHVLVDSYIIGAGRDQKEFDGIVQHEVAHALYTVNEDYRVEQNRNLSQIPYATFEAMYVGLGEIGYDHTVLSDEIQAYMITDRELLQEKAPDADVFALSTPFVLTYNKYVQGLQCTPET